MEQKHHFIGLTDAEVLESRKKNGAHILTPPEKESLWKQLIEQFAAPLIRILMVAASMSLGISFYEYWNLHESLAVFFEPVGIFVAILLATGLAFYFELRANKAFSILNQVNDDELVKVIRNNNVVEVPKKDIVVGDVVILNTGDEVPADGELLEAVTLHMDESTLTGEPVCGKTVNKDEFDKDATFPSNYVLRGTRVVEGHGVYSVLKVGDSTENGKLLASLTGSVIDGKLDGLDELKEERKLTDEEYREDVKIKYAKQGVQRGIRTPLNQQLDGLSDLITNLSYGFAARSEEHTSELQSPDHL